MAREKFGDVKLDLRDKKLLFELDFDARQSISQLAKKLGLSKQGVEYKLQRLMKEEVILGFHPVINMSKLGYTYCRLAFSIKNTDTKKEKEILNYLKKESKFYWIFSTQGIYDFGGAIWVKKISDFEEEIQKLYSKFGEFIDSKNETISTDVVYFQTRYLLGINKTKELHTDETSEIIEIDFLDKEILKVLSKDARMPLVGISEKVNSTPKVVAYRIKKLEEKGVIIAYRVSINHKKLGFSRYKLWIDAMNITKELMNEIKSSPLVIYYVKGVGMPANLDLEIMVRNSQELYEFIRKLRDKFPKQIGNYSSLIINKEEELEYKF